MANTITALAPAKINLTLQITGKRSDGYHNLRTVMQSISLCDIVTVTKDNTKKDIAVTCTDGNIPCDGRNIAFKAAKAFFEGASIPKTGILINIEKHIPSEAGLGGGSADGAAVFTALNSLFGSPLSEAELCSLSARVGADIPFCIKGGTILCEGIGEILTPLSPLPECCIVIGKGEAGISTKEAYTAADASPQNTVRNFETSVFDRGINEIADACFNAFEAVNKDKMHNRFYSEIHRIKETMLSHGALCSVMSGSGSAVFGLFTEMNAAEGCCLSLDSSGFFSALCRPIKHGAVIL